MGQGAAGGRGGGERERERERGREREREREREGGRTCLCNSAWISNPSGVNVCSGLRCARARVCVCERARTRVCVCALLSVMFVYLCVCVCHVCCLGLFFNCFVSFCFVLGGFVCLFVCLFLFVTWQSCRST